MQGPGDESGDLLNALSAVTVGMVTAFVVIAEYVDADGDVCLWSDTMTDQRAHRTIGLLEFGSAVERARITRQFLGDD